MMEAARTSETSVDNILHGSTSQKKILNVISYSSSTSCIGLPSFAAPQI
jgi:hypothetical protein